MDITRFLEFYASLAPEKETALVVRQKPIRPLAYHADGNPKCTYIAMLPSARIDPTWSVYGNTGSFVIDRFPDGRPVAQARCVDFPLVLMLDDLGVKAPMPTVPPTWLMESSPGSYQAGYALDMDGVPTKEQFIALVRALALKGLTDPGAGGVVRNFRLPGSINLKQGRNNFAARLVEFHPERQFTYQQLCELFGVTPTEPDTDPRGWSPIAVLADDGNDDVWRWLADNGLALSRPNSEGWAGVVCPNHEQHTDGNVEGRYNPAKRAYCCLHGHCIELDSRTFLAWVAEQGGPKREPGLRDELLALTMEAALSKLPMTSEESEAAAAALAEVRRKEHGRIEQADLHKHWAYVVDDDAYFNLNDRTVVSRRGFNALYAHIECRSPHGRCALITASQWFDAYRQPKDGRALAGITYAPGASVLVERDGDVLGNRWQDARPTYARGRDAALWLQHAETVLPVREERELLLDILAFKLQHPEVKINYGVLLSGRAGCGKDSLITPALWAICGPFQRNRGLVDSDQLNNQWGYHMEAEVLILNELKDTDGAARRALANKLKPLLAAPPEYLSVNRKGLKPYDALNRLLPIAFSNEQVPLVIDSTDRRWFALKSSAPIMNPADAAALWAWYANGGFDAVAELLWTRDVSAFNPGAAPMKTQFWYSLVSDGRSPAEELLIDMIESQTGEFAKGVISGPFSALCMRIQTATPGGQRIPKAALLHALAEAGWLDCGQISSREYPTRKQVYCAPSLEHHTKSDLRRMVEDRGESASPLAALRAVQ
ncbi:hypothetical protein UFOVP171_38 [uncultured Caudovirales phage]|uniref:RepB DNA-primase from phage plasmid n=1 Tax=uncultured Caudovirales phage TaxID=2100421 RepID=A0A6J7WC17_9CAUD|nr:hypothetical protein UFOVP171_38 [uncultured Caudovirales phage]